MKVLLCCILKMENNYLNEWINHYIKLGIDKIVIYDNNDINGPYAENIEDIKIIKEGKENGIIDVYKIPYETCVQLKYYNECYKNYSDYDWLLFLDIDEYLMLENYTNIKDFLKQDKFKNYNIIHFNWKTFTDNEQLYVEDNNYSLVDRFTTPCKDIPSINKKLVDREIKSIVRGGIENLKFSKNPHTLDSIKTPCCNVLGENENNDAQKSKTIIHNEAWVNHYICKTIEEYCKNKLIRLGGHTIHKRNVRYTRQFFFTYNKITNEKIKIFNKLFNEIKHTRITHPVKAKLPVTNISPITAANPIKPIQRIKYANSQYPNDIKKISVLKSSIPPQNKLKQIK